jgi:hypothetical protein
MFASLVVDTRRSFALAAQLRRTYNGICHFSSRDLAVQHGRHHPCWKAAHFLPCTRPPDVLLLHRPQRGRIHYGPSQRIAFVTTRSGLQTMPTGGHGDDVDTAAVAAGTVRRLTPIAPPLDLQSALAPLDDDKYGSKVFENLGMQDFIPDRASPTQGFPSFVVTLEFWVRFPNERNQGKQAHPVLKYRVPHGSQPRHGWASDPPMVGIRSPISLVVTTEWQRTFSFFASQTLIT